MGDPADVHRILKHPAVPSPPRAREAAGKVRSETSDYNKVMSLTRGVGEMSWEPAAGRLIEAHYPP